MHALSFKGKQRKYVVSMNKQFCQKPLSSANALPEYGIIDLLFYQYIMKASVIVW